MILQCSIILILEKSILLYFIVGKMEQVGIALDKQN